MCPNPRRWFPRCKFEPRYSSGPAQTVSPEQIAAFADAMIFSDDTAKAVAAMSRGATTYVGEVCTRCGTFIRGEDVQKDG